VDENSGPPLAQNVLHPARGGLRYARTSQRGELAAVRGNRPVRAVAHPDAEWNATAPDTWTSLVVRLDTRIGTLRTAIGRTLSTGGTRSGSAHRPVDECALAHTGIATNEQ